MDVSQPTRQVPPTVGGLMASAPPPAPPHPKPKPPRNLRELLEMTPYPDACVGVTVDGQRIVWVYDGADA